MHIDDDHMFHVAALTQLAEDPEFTAINRFENTSARGAFRINTSTGVYLKHASKPIRGEYVFTFNEKNLAELAALKPQCTRLFIVMVCVMDRQICCITNGDLEAHIARRKADAGKPEDQYQLIVTLPVGKSFRVYVNAAGVKRTSLHQQIVSRNKYPHGIFE